MDILFCGTAAAEGFPGLFCTCDTCGRARERGGKDLRSRAAYMIGDRVRIDFGPDSNYHQLRYGLSYDLLETLLITHSHDDHWYPTDLNNRQTGYSVVTDRPLDVWGNARVEEKLHAALECSLDAARLRFSRLTPWQPIALPDCMTAAPVLAAHDPAEECVNYVVERSGRRALFGHDTGWYSEETWEFLSDKPLNIVILDCTYGSEDHRGGHMGGLSVVEARDELGSRGALAADAVVVATHFSHNGGWVYEELERYFAPHGIVTGYDGLILPLTSESTGAR